MKKQDKPLSFLIKCLVFCILKIKNIQRKMKNEKAGQTLLFLIKRLMFCVLKNQKHSTQNEE